MSSYIGIRPLPMGYHDIIAAGCGGLASDTAEIDLIWLRWDAGHGLPVAGNDMSTGGP